MSKLILTIFSLAVILLTSCKKDYSCTCDDRGEEITKEIENATDEEALKSCEKLSEHYSFTGGSCSLN